MISAIELKTCRKSFSCWKQSSNYGFFQVGIERVFLAAGYEAVLAAAIPRRHLLVPLHVVVGAQDALDGGASLGIHPSPFGSSILEPNLEI